MKIVRTVTQRLQTTFDAAGKAVAALTPPGGQYEYHLEYLSVSTTSVLISDFSLYAGPEGNNNYVDGSPSGNKAASAYDPAFVIQSNEELTLVWTNGTPGRAAFARVQYRLVDPSDGGR